MRPGLGLVPFSFVVAIQYLVWLWLGWMMPARLPASSLRSVPFALALLLIVVFYSTYSII